MLSCHLQINGNIVAAFLMCMEISKIETPQFNVIHGGFSFFFVTSGRRDALLEYKYYHVASKHTALLEQEYVSIFS